MNNFNVTVTDISYLYSNDGNVIPYLRISPFINCSENNFITGIPLTLMENESDFDVAPGDRVSVSINGIKFLVKITDRIVTDRSDIRIITCPICHQPMVFENGFSYCHNCDCRAQLETHIHSTFREYGVEFVGNNLRILVSVISRLLVRSPVDLFWLTTEQISSEDVSVDDARFFQQTIHAVRGNITSFQFFRSLNVHGMTDEIINSIVSLMNSLNFSIRDVPKLMDVELMNSHPEINWYPWLQFISYENNRIYISRLSEVMYI